ncbi:restriction endonuclease subunit S [Flavobacterium sp. 140616W15]|uniref:restriction endonuclease subunit S n=1 Tax=Flavobacterium sp. 140616W15 TaxID=2478552 RepID=UPI000F0C08B6|nr:restriction endonuclease subunit S [Flavobacterium sp. 140616W15]AYN04789.1 restriction endonuclease subunit S [Flavobacterium sp. 140616W15]
MAEKQIIKSSFYGAIPLDWNSLTFQDCISGFSSGSTPSRLIPQYFNGNINWITSGELNYNVINITKERVTSQAIKNSNLKILDSGTFLIAITGLEAEKVRGACGIVGQKSVSNQSCMALYPNKHLLDKMYLFYFYAFNGDKLAFRYCQGTKQQSYNAKLVKILPIIFPPLPEQKEIANCLSTWDKAIENQITLIKAKEILKKAIMKELLTGKKRLPGFNEDWKEFKYSQLIKQVTRKEQWDDSKIYKLISIKRRSGGVFARQRLFGHQIEVKQLVKVKENDFLISKMQIVHGASSIVRKEFEDYYVSGSYVILNIKDEKVLTPFYLDYVSKQKSFYHQTYIASYGVHIEKMTFDFKSFLKMKITLPSLLEQEKITKIIDIAQKEIQIEKQKLADLQKQKKGLMQQLLTGKVRLV